MVRVGLRSLSVVAALFAIFLAAHTVSAKPLTTISNQETTNTGSITIINQTVPAGGTNFFYYGGLGTFFLDDGQSQLANNVAIGDITVQQSVPAGWQLQIGCVGGSVTLLADGVTIHLAAGDSVVCTFTNSDVGGSITIVNATTPAGGSDFFYYGGIGSFLLDDGQSQFVDDRLPGDYTILQVIPAGWTLSVSCSGGDFTLLAEGVTIHLDANEAISCTFTNTDVGGSITIVNATTPAGGSGFFYFGGLGTFSLDDGQSQFADNRLPGDYTVLQTVPAGWTLSVSCSGGDVTLLAEGVTIHLDANENISCTFTNADVGGSITIMNTSNPSGATGFAYFSNLGNFSLDDGGSHLVNDLLPGNYEVTQTVLAGWTLTINCVGGDSTPVTNGVTIALDAGEDIVCTFANADVGGSITIINASAPTGATGFSYAGDLGVFSLDDGQNRAEMDLFPGNYEVSQTVAAPWVLGIQCSGGDSTSLGENGVTIHLDAREDIVCTFTNSDVGGSITIVNAANPADGTMFSYFGDFGSFALADGGNGIFADLYPGDYDIQQTIPAGWLMAVDCFSASHTLIDEGATVHLSANEDVVCSFSNTFIGGTLTIHMESTPAGGTNFTLVGGLGTFDLNDGESRTFAGLVPNTYVIFEEPPSGWVLETAVCDNGQDPRVGVDVATNDDLNCTFSNISGPTAVLLHSLDVTASQPPSAATVAKLATLLTTLLVLISGIRFASKL